MNKVNSRSKTTTALFGCFYFAIIGSMADAELPSEANSPERNSAIVAEIEKSYQEASSKIVGSETPEKVPLRTKLGQLIRYYDSDHRYLKSILSSEDDAILRAASAKDKQAREEEGIWYMQSYTPLCSTMQTLDGYVLAKMVDSLSEAASVRILERYQQTMNQLSPDGRQTVMEYVAKTITPALTLSVLDTLQFAQKHPDVYRLKAEHRCHYYLTGRQHPDVQKAIDALQDDASLVMDIEQSSSSAVSAELE